MIWFGIGCLITIIILYIILLNKFKKLKQKYFELNNNIYNEEKEKREEQLKKDTESLYERFQEIDSNYRSSVWRLEQLNREITQKQNFNNDLKKIREEELDRLFEEKKKEKEAALTAELKLKEEELQRGHRELVEIWTDQIEEEKAKLQKQVEEILSELNTYKQKRDAANEAIMREKEIREKESFYKINISKSDIEDIETLEQIRPRLKNREALSKLIWEVFIRRECQEMIKRITSGRKVCGIYKITYTKTGEAYIGKTTDIQTRWQNHIKTTIGLDGCAHSTFHTRMEKDGFWNYTFEILEEVEKEKLGEREKYWIKFYNTTAYGLNQKEG